MRRHLFLLTVLAIKTSLGISVNLHSVSLLSSYVPLSQAGQRVSPKNVLRAEETMTADWQQWGPAEEVAARKPQCATATQLNTHVVDARPSTAELLRHIQTVFGLTQICVIKGFLCHC